MKVIADLCVEGDLTITRDASSSGGSGADESR
jgi:hypothetical protein